ncbi:MAG TPA: hypothetical protein VEK73_12765 [Xanthobacteraceae bacterium]|nr:hypothetical protein [Xanthobacteraceae bacterium]
MDPAVSPDAAVPAPAPSFADQGPDDWIEPAAAQTVPNRWSDGGPDDWIMPPVAQRAASPRLDDGPDDWISVPVAQRAPSPPFDGGADDWIAPPAGISGNETAEATALRAPSGYGGIWGAITDWLYRDVDKQITESTPGKYIADVAHIYDSGPTFIDPQTGTETHIDPAKHLVRPEGGQLKVYERVDKTRPIGLQDLGIVRAVTEPVEAFGKALRGELLPDEAVPAAAGAALLGAMAGRSPAGRLPGQVARDAPPPPDAPPTSPSAPAPAERVGVLKLTDDMMSAARARLRAMFEGVTAGPPQSPERLPLGEVTAEGAQRINQLLREGGIDADVTGYRHEVDADAARHAFKRHGSAATEEPRGQIPLTADDWELIPDVLAAPDHMAYIGPTRRGREAIGYWKRMDGHIFYIEEVRTGRGTLAAVTMRKYRTGSAGGAGKTTWP